MTQTDALEVLKSGANVFLTGEPGAGKSYTINMFKAWAKERGIYPSVTASTGIAATHIDGITIHSWAGIGIKKSLTTADIRAILTKDYVVQRIRNCKVLIIDEISMIDAPTLDMVDKVCREARSGGTFLPFGGIQVIFVGDFFQLPPVAKNPQTGKPAPVLFAFQSDAWLAADPQVCYLHEQHRQEDPAFLDLLTSMRSGTLNKTHHALLKKQIRKAPKDITRLFTHNADVDRVNDEELAKLKGEMKTYTMISTGVPFLVDLLKKNCLSPEVLQLKIGAPVMFTRNDTQKDGSRGAFVNGTLGTVTDFTEDGYPVVELRDGSELWVTKREEWSIEEKGYTKAKISQIPLRLAWAITVHKCQGMSLDAATMDLSRSFEFGQGYVALSRVRSLEGLYLEGINEKALQMHPTVVEKDGMFRKISQ